MTQKAQEQRGELKNHPEFIPIYEYRCNDLPHEREVGKIENYHGETLKRFFVETRACRALRLDKEAQLKGFLEVING